MVTVIQVHITQGDYVGRGVIVSWVTPVEPGSDLVLYGPASDKSKYQAHARLTTYKFGNYTSGYIHHCKLKNLDVSMHDSRISSSKNMCSNKSWFKHTQNRNKNW